MNKRLHIVCLDAPSPPDYGGAIDMFYKIKSLAEAGVKITLHYFKYKEGRGTEELVPYCERIYAYSRKNLLASLRSFPLPYIVSSRINDALIDRLNEDEEPILLEGIHCTGILPYLKKKQRRVVVRIHNNEGVYYEKLATSEKKIRKKIYYKIESFLLKRFEKKLPEECIYAPLSSTDVAFFSSIYKQVYFLPAFIPWSFLNVQTGIGNYCLYHGNLSVAENIEAAEWLIEKVFAVLNIPLVVAGKNIAAPLQKKYSHFKQVQFINNPSFEKMDELVRNAQLHVLPSLNSTGVKIKLLHALFNGRFCLVNKAAVTGSGLEAFVSVAETPEEWQQDITTLFHKPFDAEIAEMRKALLQQYNNQLSAQMLITWIW